MRMKPRIFVTRRIAEAGLHLLTPHCEVEVWPGEEPPSREELRARVPGCHGLLTLLSDRVDEELLAVAGPQLRVVSNHAAGVDNIDVAAATRRGILVTNTPDVLTETTADLAFALICATSRRLVEGVDWVRAGRWKTWSPLFLLGQDLFGATLGLVGLGRIGRAVARRAQGFAMRVLWYDPSLPAERAPAGLHRCDTLDELLRAADVVSLHVPLTPATRGLFDVVALRAMKPTAVLINTCRGQVVDTAALVQALQEGWIAGAGLDVTDPEPLPADHSLVSEPRCIVLPHIGSASTATRGRMAELAAADLLAGLRGEPPRHPVNPEVLARGRGDC
jgi:phosphoglycerate dehydrogenase-like enzyme